MVHRVEVGMPRIIASSHSKVRVMRSYMIEVLLAVKSLNLNCISR